MQLQGTEHAPLPHRLAVVSGGGSGIGLALAEMLASSGVTVVVASRSTDRVQDAARTVNERLGADRLVPMACDVSDSGSVDATAAEILDRLGDVDLLVNTAGYAVPERVSAITAQGWDDVMAVNARGAMAMTRALLPSMLARDFGDIVNISSQAGKHGYPDVPSYCAAKFALLGFAEALRAEVHERRADIRVLNVCPGLVDVGKPHQATPDRVSVATIPALVECVLRLDRNVVLGDLELTARPV